MKPVKLLDTFHLQYSFPLPGMGNLTPEAVQNLWKDALEKVRLADRARFEEEAARIMEKFKE